MPTSIREQTVAKVATILAAISGVSVERWRGRPVGNAQTDRLIVHEGTQRNVREDEDANGKLIEAEVPIEGHVKAATHQALGTALNELYAKTVQALAADRTLGLSFVIWSGEGDLETDLDDEEGHGPRAAFMITWSVLYQVATTDPYSAPS